jgi:hypothetical protein
MVDFQGVCLQRMLQLEKSAGGLFRGVRKTNFSSINFYSISFLDSSIHFHHVMEYN